MKNTGGSVFPTKKRIREGVCLTDEYEHVGGVTLRDYFAAKAMQAYASDANWREEMSLEATARISYLLADAMLKAREA